MMIRLIAALAGFVVLFNGQFARGQFCEATSASQLQALLDCIANCGSSSCTVQGCSDICSHRHIVIPQGTTIQFDSTIELNASHQGLWLTVNGTLEWSGGPGSSHAVMPKLIQITGDPQDDLNITIDGSGTIRTPFVACQNWTDHCVEPPDGLFFIAEGIVIRFDARHITVKDITLENMYMGVKVDSTSSNISLANLNVEEMTLYGIFNDGVNVTIQDCDFNGAYAGFGIGNHGSGTRIFNCSVINAGGGFHVRGGSNVTIHGFQSFGQWCTVGPDPGIPDPDARVTCVDIRDIVITGPQPSHLLKINMGTVNCWVENVVTENQWSLEVGRNPTPGITNRATNAVYWRNLSGLHFIYENSCLGPDIHPRPCRADIDDDGSVGVPDLLAVINGWGACGTGSVCGQTLDHCPADIPGGGSQSCGSVGVPDLLEVINGWGPC